MLTLMSLDGWKASLTVNVFVSPSLTDTLVGETTSDCRSLSASVPVTLTVVRPLDVTLNTAEPFARSISSAAASVTDCGVSQLTDVNVNVAAPERSLSPEVLATVTVTSLAG